MAKMIPCALQTDNETARVDKWIRHRSPYGYCTRDDDGYWLLGSYPTAHYLGKTLEDAIEAAKSLKLEKGAK